MCLTPAHSCELHLNGVASVEHAQVGGGAKVQVGAEGRTQRDGGGCQKREQRGVLAHATLSAPCMRNRRSVEPQLRLAEGLGSQRRAAQCASAAARAYWLGG